MEAEFISEGGCILPLLQPTPNKAGGQVSAWLLQRRAKRLIRVSFRFRYVCICV